MSTVPTYPGVYIQELPSAVRTITGVATSVTAFIGSAKMGPTGEQTLIHSWADFESIFGGLWAESNMSYAVYQFFLNGGSDAVIVRVFAPTFRTVGNATGSTQAGTTTYYAIEGAAAPNATESSVQTPMNPSALTTFAGFYVQPTANTINTGTTTITVRKNSSPTSVTVSIPPSGTTTSLAAVSDTSHTFTFNAGDDLDIEVVASGASGSLSFNWAFATSPILSGDSNTVEVSTATYSVRMLDSNGQPTTNTLYLEEANPGSWGRNIAFSIDSLPADLVSPPPDPTIFNLSIALYDAVPSVDTASAWPPSVPSTGKLKTGNLLVTETFRNVSLQRSSPQYIVDVLQQQSTLLRVSTSVLGSAVNTWFTSSSSPPATTPPPTCDFTQQDNETPPRYVINAISQGLRTGDDGQPLTSANFTQSQQNPKQGIWALEDADIFNLLCIPPYDSTDGNHSSDLYKTVYPNAISYCEHKRAMVLIDPPSDWYTAAEAVTGVEASSFPKRNPNAALYFPRLNMADPLNAGKSAEFVPCGVVAGVIAQTDGSRGVWKAPAGTEAILNGVLDLTMGGNPVRLTDGENGSLNPLAVNCLRVMPVVGPVIWGARTLNGADRLADQWKYLPIRRLALFLEESLYRGTQWVVFEPNDEPLWSQIRLNVGAFMQTYFLKGAFQGTTPKEAYFVKCDSETTTPTDQNNGIVNIVVGFAPLKPAEFVIIKIQQIAAKPGGA
jgi:phage tail sheath protein FI